MPAVVLMLVLLAYPFVLAAYISMSSRVLGEPGKFLGFRNSLTLLQDSLFPPDGVDSTVWLTRQVFFHSSVVRASVFGGRWATSESNY